MRVDALFLEFLLENYRLPLQFAPIVEIVKFGKTPIISLTQTARSQLHFSVSILTTFFDQSGTGIQGNFQKCEEAQHHWPQTWRLLF